MSRNTKHVEHNAYNPEYRRERAVEFALRNKSYEVVALEGSTSKKSSKCDLLLEAKKIEKYLKTGK